MLSVDPNHTQGLDIIIVARGYSTPLLTATATDPNGTKNYVPADKPILVVVELRLYKSSSFVENEVHKCESRRYKIALRLPRNTTV